MTRTINTANSKTIVTPTTTSIPTPAKKVSAAFGNLKKPGNVSRMTWEEALTGAQADNLTSALVLQKMIRDFLALAQGNALAAFRRPTASNWRQAWKNAEVARLNFISDCYSKLLTMIDANVALLSAKKPVPAEQWEQFISHRVWDNPHFVGLLTLVDMCSLVRGLRTNKATGQYIRGGKNAGMLAIEPTRTGYDLTIGERIVEITGKNVASMIAMADTKFGIQEIPFTRNCVMSKDAKTGITGDGVAFLITFAKPFKGIEVGTYRVAMARYVYNVLYAYFLAKDQDERISAATMALYAQVAGVPANDVEVQFFHVNSWLEKLQPKQRPQYMDAGRSQGYLDDDMENLRNFDRFAPRYIASQDAWLADQAEQAAKRAAPAPKASVTPAKKQPVAPAQEVVKLVEGQLDFDSHEEEDEDDDLDQPEVVDDMSDDEEENMPF